MPPFLVYCKIYPPIPLPASTPTCALVRGMRDRFTNKIKNVKSVDKFNLPIFFAKSLLIEFADLKFICLIIMYHVNVMHVCGACGPSEARLWTFLRLMDKL